MCSVDLAGSKELVCSLGSQSPEIVSLVLWLVVSY